ncbi:MAG: lipopolysaccharide biosynthesis protein, partial [Paludibacteraceae bacterium]
MGIIARQSIKATIATYFGVAVGFFTTFFVLTRFLTAEEIGLTRVMIDAATLFVSLAQLGTSSSIIRFFPYFRQKEHTKGGAGANFSSAGETPASPVERLPINSDMHRNRTSLHSDHGFFFWTVVIPLVGFLLFALLYWACRVPLGQWFGEKSPLFLDYYYFVLPLAFFLLYQTIFETNCNVLMRIVVPRVVREVVVRLGLLACYLLYAFRVLSLDGFVVALCVNYGIAALINLGYLIALGQISFRPDWQFLRTNIPLVRNYVRYSSFVFVSALAAALGPTLSSFFITAKMGLDYTGIFAIATYIAVIVSIPYRSLTAIASPQLARATKEQNHAEAQTLIHQVSS